MVKRKPPGTVTLLAGGDVGPVVEPVDRFAELILPFLEGTDYRFFQCERTYSERGFSPQFAFGGGGQKSRLDPRMASIFKTAKADVVSLASNHAMDWGPEPLLDTVELFRRMGIEVVGAGKDDAEARKPVILEKNGVRIGILAYCSVLRDGQAAGLEKAGVAPMRAHTYYEAGDFQPGTPPTVITVPYEEDLKRLQEDIRQLKGKTDAVVLSLHWGVHYLPKVIATYQPLVAHAAIDAGADLILGHHAHILKAVEVYKGKVCFYSICNLLTTGQLRPRLPYEWNLFWWETDPETPLYGFPMDSKKTMVVKVSFSKRGVERVSFYPAFINRQAQPEIVNEKEARFQEILQYMEWVSDQFPHTFKIEGNEIVIQTPL
jgi:hypothetical protein